MINQNKLTYIYEHWKLGVHLLFKTKRFGVNNQWWASFDSLFGARRLSDRFRLIRNYKLMKIRAKIGFLPEKEYNMIYGKDKKNK